MLYSQWLSLPLHVRARIAQKFGIAKVSSTHVVNNEVVSDGYKIQDVETVLSSETVKEYVGVDADPPTFINLLAAKIEAPEVVPEVIPEEAPEVSPVKEEAPKPKKAVKKATKKVIKRKK